MKELSFPYTFTEEIIAGDENGILVYSFYGMDENNSVVDAADLVLTVELAQIPLLLKYDWVLASQTIKGEDTATPDLKDDIHRFNSDLTWQVDWGFIFSSAALETLNSYCAWQVTMDGATVKTLSFQGWGMAILQMKECWKFIRQYPKLKILLLIGDKIRITIL